MILLVDPHQEGLAVVVPEQKQGGGASGERLQGQLVSPDLDSPDPSGVGPVAGHPGARQERRDGLVKQEVVGNQLLLLGIGHGLQRVVLALELPVQAGQGCRNHLD